MIANKTSIKECPFNATPIKTPTGISVMKQANSKVKVEK